MRRRSTVRRLVVTALNLIAPGLGLLRVGDWQRVGLSLASPVALLWAIAVILWRIATPSPAGFAAIAGTMLLVGATILIFALVTTWRGSVMTPARRRWWSRWPVLLVAGIAAQIAAASAVDALHALYKPFYLPSDSMAPTLSMNEKLVADMRDHKPRVGGLVLVTTPLGLYVKRVVAVAGNRIAMRGGWPVVDGVEAARRLVARTGDGRIFVERLPGEAGGHRILDTGDSPIDDMAAVTVPPGQVFVLGDNRDRSADSRVSVEMDGTGMVALDRIVGRPLFIHWSADRRRIGRRL